MLVNSLSEPLRSTVLKHENLSKAMKSSFNDVSQIIFAVERSLSTSAGSGSTGSTANNKGKHDQRQGKHGGRGSDRHKKQTSNGASKPGPGDSCTLHPSAQHTNAECRQQAQRTSTQNTAAKTCFSCGQAGHLKKDCTSNKNKRNERQ
jgi:hypothetical protein